MIDENGPLEHAGLRHDHLGTPEILRWLLIRPNGTVSVRQSDNRIAYLAEHDLWLQWRLERDVHRDVDPFTRGPWSLIVWSVAIPTQKHGVVITARFDTDRPGNHIATALLDAVGIDYHVRGAAAWVGNRDPGTGLHHDLNDAQLSELRTLAAHCRS